MNRIVEEIDHRNFTQDVLKEHVQLLMVHNNQGKIEFTVGPDFHQDIQKDFVVGTNECTSSILGAGGVPLSYLIRDDSLKPKNILNNPDCPVATKIYWNSKFRGPFYTSDKERVWTYLASRCLRTEAWAFIKKYKDTKDARTAWTDLWDFYVGSAESKKEYGNSMSISKGSQV